LATLPNNYRVYGNVTIEKLLEVLSAEPAIDTLAEMYQSFYESVEVMGKGCLTQKHMETFIESAQSALDDYKERVKGAPRRLKT